MKNTTTLQGCLFIAFILAVQCSFAQTPIVSDMAIEPDAAQWTLAQQQSYLLHIAGPDNYVFEQQLDEVEDIHLAPVQADGTPFVDGNYQISITPVYRLTADQQRDLSALRMQGNDTAIRAYRVANGLPLETNVYTVNFGVKDGVFIRPNRREAPVPTPGVAQRRPNFQTPDAIYASLNYFETDYGVTAVGDNSMEEMQVFTQDVIVQGSLCVGIDCSSSENFGFDTQRLKENNLRIHFDDTSGSASFPSNDWRITINDSANGGASYFAIEDATANNRPFEIAAGAGANALTIDSQGDVGIGTANAAVELHVADGDTPTLRLEQNGSSGFASQTWDVAGNETNFFVRDLNNSSSLVLRLRAGAPTNSIFVQNNGNVGLGTENPTSKLQVESGNVQVKSGNLTLTSGNLSVNGMSMLTGTTIMSGDLSSVMPTGATFLSGTTFTPILRLDAVNSRVGIGTTTPGHQLELSTDDAAKPSGGDWIGASDRRLKQDIRDFNDGLDVLMQIRPVTYRYNGILDLPTEDEHVGIIAQEIQKIAPYTIETLKLGGGDQGYLGFDGSALTYVLINAVQEQQTQIEALEAQLSAMTQAPAAMPMALLAENDELATEIATPTVAMDENGRLLGSARQATAASEQNVARDVLKGGSDEDIPGQVRQEEERTNVFPQDFDNLEDELLNSASNVEIVNEINEMKEAIAMLAAANEQLRAENSQMRRSMSNCCTTDLGLDANDAYLVQNVPNPAEGSTRVEFFLPEGLENAEIQIHDLIGTPIQSFAIDQAGYGMIDVQRTDLPAGTYLYYLSVDGKVVDSKVMILK